MSNFSEIIEQLKSDDNINGSLKKNLLSGTIEFNKNVSWSFSDSLVLNDNDLIHLKNYISKTFKKDISVQKLNELIVILADEITYHPIRNYLEKLEWDEKPRLEKWLTEICGAKDNEYYREIGKKVFCGAVRRVRVPGAKFDYMMILEGAQGIGKSTLLNILGGKWYLDTHLSTSENKKDVIDVIRSSWIVEISDLAGFRKHDVEYLKSFISRQVDRVRMPYARRAEDFPRQCVFIGTHNPSGDNQYFRDDTGNRRFWPVECSKIDLKKAREWRDQLWAEAVWIEPGQNLYIENQESIDIISRLHDDREIETPLNGLIEEYIKGKNAVNNKDIMEKVFNLQIGKLSFMELRSKATVIGIFMRSKGWIRGENERRGWYFRPGHDYDLIEKEKESVEW